MHGDRPPAHLERRRCRLRQRHRGAWRRFRRHVRGRSGACRCGDRARGSRGLRAAQSRWPHGADRHRRRHGSFVPVEPRGAEGCPQGRVSPDRDLRCHGGGCGRRRGARPECQADRRRARHRRQHGRGHHRVSRRGRVDQTAARGLGGAVRHSGGDFGTRWVTDTLAFKPYPCGTMAQPYIDCARRLAARGVKATDIKEIVCEVAEGTVHRLWEPLADKQQPRNGYAAKFATPYLLATSFVHGGVGLGAFTEEAIRDSVVLALASKVKYVIDPKNPYPNNYTGHVRATMKDGSVIEERQPYLRGGAQEPLTRQDVTDKFALNAQHGGWTKAQRDATLRLLAMLYRSEERRV